MKKIFGLPVWIIVMIAVAVVVVVFWVFSSLNPWNPLKYFGPPDSNVDTSRASVIRQIQSLNRLETASYTLDKVIEAGTDGNAFQDLLYGDKILIIAHGTVVAGIDLSTIQPADVVINGKILKIQAPNSEVLSVTLDNNQTKVFDRRLGLLSKGDQNLETKARQAAEQSIKQAACEGGILTDAARNAQDRLRQMYSLAGFQHVVVTVAAGSC